DTTSPSCRATTFASQARLVVRGVESVGVRGSPRSTVVTFTHCRTEGRPHMSATNAQIAADHHMRVDTVSSKPKKVLILVSNPTTATTVGWRVGFWGAELTHPYYELTERGVEVTIASPDGGKVELDALSDSRDESKWSS